MGHHRREYLEILVRTGTRDVGHEGRNLVEVVASTGLSFGPPDRTGNHSDAIGRITEPIMDAFRHLCGLDSKRVHGTQPHAKVGRHRHPSQIHRKARGIIFFRPPVDEVRLVDE